MKVTVLISGGIDSPVAAYIMSKAGADVVLLHMDNGSYGDPKEVQKARKLAARLSEVTGRELPLYIADHEVNQKEIGHRCETGYRCVMCKRMMHRVAKRFSQEHGCEAIVLGDSLGQVASQTLKNIKAEQRVLGFPVLRPLIGLDKNEIIDIAKEIGTFDISIIKSKGCLAVPAKPITEASADKVLKQQEAMDFDATIEKSAASAKLSVQ